MNFQNIKHDPRHAPLTRDRILAYQPLLADIKPIETKYTLASPPSITRNQIEFDQIREQEEHREQIIQQQSKSSKEYLLDAIYEHLSLNSIYQTSDMPVPLESSELVLKRGSSINSASKSIKKGVKNIRQHNRKIERVLKAHIDPKLCHQPASLRAYCKDESFGMNAVAIKECTTERIRILEERKKALEYFYEITMEKLMTLNSASK